MTREEARLKLECTVNRGFDRVDPGIMIESLEALGLIKFDESEDDKFMKLAKKYAKDIIYYENDLPLNTITEMSHVISFLLKKVENK